MCPLALLALLSPLVINEICYDPVGPDGGAEFVELLNPGPLTVGLAGVRLEFANGAEEPAWRTRWTGGPADSLVVLTVKRDEAMPFDVTIRRDHIEIPVLESEITADNLLLVSLFDFSNRSAQEMRAALEQGIDRLEQVVAYKTCADVLRDAQHYRDQVIPAMENLRQVADQIEEIVADDLWPLPSYREMLFIK